jgi:uncharacterized protein
MPEGRQNSILKDEFGGDGSIADDIAGMLRGSEQDLYSSVVSSSFDSDRLDYLRRDRMMTGSGAGAIDFEWLLDNLRVVDVPANSGEDPQYDIGKTIQAFGFEKRPCRPLKALSSPDFIYTRKSICIKLRVV